MNARSGTLYVVATPIGNLDDLSPRARSTLATVSVVAAEDTRHTGRLLTQLGIDATLVSLHEQNEAARVPALLDRLAGGESIALVSDAGTPLVSDPGYRLLAGARERGIAVSPVPGCCAAVAALSVAGLPVARFHFEGFLPARPEARRARLAALAARTETLLFYEAVHRIGDMLADAAILLGGTRPATLARELTKRHETLYRGSLDEVRAQVEADAAGRRGEYTLVVAGAPPAEAADAELARTVAILAAELPPSQAASLAARITGAPRRRAYEMAMQRGRSEDTGGE